MTDSFLRYVSYYVFVLQHAGDVFILQVVFLLSDSRGHKINVKNIYGCRLDTHFAVGGCNTLKASKSKQVGTVNRKFTYISMLVISAD